MHTCMCFTLVLDLCTVPQASVLSLLLRHDKEKGGAHKSATVRVLCCPLWLPLRLPLQCTLVLTVQGHAFPFVFALDPTSKKKRCIYYRHVCYADSYLSPRRPQQSQFGQRVAMAWPGRLCNVSWSGSVSWRKQQPLGQRPKHRPVVVPQVQVQVVVQNATLWNYD